MVKGKEKDPQKIVGSCVEAPAFHIIAKQECSKQFGSEKKTHKFKGVVIRSYSLKNPGANCGTTYVEAEYDLL